ncbi:hypothetical protein PaeBR_17900 [Paenibacillus sp. BR2-3]|uniref:hypothetical protein n=1 Tax=Paenibacillus sp. BR2-3 TaxID=3048494 RepID=UPI0039776209
MKMEGEKLFKKVVYSMLNKAITLSILLAVISFGGWIYGNSMEQNDMTNSGLQVFGALGTTLFLAIFILLLFAKIILKARKKSI